MRLCLILAILHWAIITMWEKKEGNFPAKIDFTDVFCHNVNDGSH